MAILVDDEKMYKLYQESKIGNALKIGAMGAASFMGSAPDSQASEPQSIEKHENKLTTQQFIDLWIKHYQTDGSVKGKEKDAKKKSQNAYLKLRDGISFPSDAVKSLNVAVGIFGGDEGVSPQLLKDLLIYTGEVESDYTTRKQYGGGPARGFWQVEPKTAVDLLINSRAYFGRKFQQKFGKDLFRIKVNNKWSQDYLAQRMEEDDDLAAAFAAAKWVSVSDRAGLRNIQY